MCAVYTGRGGQDAVNQLHRKGPIILIHGGAPKSARLIFQLLLNLAMSTR
jgi:hypothetical protein